MIIISDQGSIIFTMRLQFRKLKNIAEVINNLRKEYVYLPGAALAMPGVAPEHKQLQSKRD